MAKVYEALRRAEEERKRKVAGGVAPVPAVEWDPTPDTAPKPKKSVAAASLSAAAIHRGWQVRGGQEEKRDHLCSITYPIIIARMEFIHYESGDWIIGNNLYCFWWNKSR